LHLCCEILYYTYQLKFIILKFKLNNQCPLLFIKYITDFKTPERIFSLSTDLRMYWIKIMFFILFFFIFMYLTYTFEIEYVFYKFRAATS